MKRFHLPMTLNARITLSFVLLMAAVMAFVVIAEQLDYDELRAYVMLESLNDDAPELEQNLSQGIVPALPEGSALFTAQTAPDALRHYGPGYHRTTYPVDGHLLVFERANQRWFLVQDGNKYRYLEAMIDGFAPVVIMVCILCAFWIGRLTSARVTAPIIRLADAVQRNQKPLPFQTATDEIGVLARAFARHSDELERFLQREQCFVGDASHELRTPLAIIGGAAETIVHQLPADSHVLSGAQRIVRTTQEMQRQLTCLLLLSRDPHTLTFDNVPLYPLIEECIARCQPWLGKKTVALHIDVPRDASAYTHAELARSVIWNLLRNACQYTDQGEIRVVLAGTTLTISDTGPGLPSSLGPGHFPRFQHEPRQSGEGLGLSIVHRIVEHLGWQMVVESSDQGCCFTLELLPATP
ncbi:sensor histidine kinase [Atlantibacter hermannii]|uniref:sensor histidine kinase n=1 Tax=Atlantibacter hermannii TaxID=565 RepID=UPI0005C1C162|nr:HAMP domain-containing sensor histidine kinase [Atlantibacter hermannii]KIU34683.1 histidine kinase [Atlantibacter hermannii]MCQ4969425.1 HAMP domain-containing histidine kinase [Enterobacteriaceae bacterium DFI.7.85]MDQ7883482.1 HAMP domain-containing sensor histidine kinase [Atlantibacter hermannii]